MMGQDANHKMWQGQGGDQKSYDCQEPCSCKEQCDCQKSMMGSEGKHPKSMMGDKDNDEGVKIVIIKLDV
jgi:hypothetical protein